MVRAQTQVAVFFPDSRFLFIAKKNANKRLARLHGNSFKRFVGEKKHKVSWILFLTGKSRTLKVGNCDLIGHCSILGRNCGLIEPFHTSTVKKIYICVVTSVSHKRLVAIEIAAMAANTLLKSIRSSSSYTD